MKITRLETFIVPPRWLFLKIETDEASSAGASPLSKGAPIPWKRPSTNSRTISSAKTRC